MPVYSIALRKRTIELVESGATPREAAETLGVSETFVRRLVRRKEETGSIAPLPRTNAGRKPKLDGPALALLTQSVCDFPERTLREHRAAVGIECSLSVIHAAIRKLGLQELREAALDGRTSTSGNGRADTPQGTRRAIDPGTNGKTEPDGSETIIPPFVVSRTEFRKYAIDKSES